MSMDNITFKEGATYAPTGGTDITFSETGEQVSGGIVSHNAGETDFYAREKLYAVSRQPVLGSDGDMTKGKVSLRIVRPYTLNSGKVVYNVGRFELEIHPEAGQTEATNIRSLLLGAGSSASADNFFLSGSLR